MLLLIGRDEIFQSIMIIWYKDLVWILVVDMANTRQGYIYIMLYITNSKPKMSKRRWIICICHILYCKTTWVAVTFTDQLHFHSNLVYHILHLIYSFIYNNYISVIYHVAVLWITFASWCTIIQYSWITKLRIKWKAHSESFS